MLRSVGHQGNSRMVVRADRWADMKLKLIIVHCTSLTRRQVSQEHRLIWENLCSTSCDQDLHRLASLTCTELNTSRIAGA